jgi:hypothetical protein
MPAVDEPCLAMALNLPENLHPILTTATQPKPSFFRLLSSSTNCRFKFRF